MGRRVVIVHVVVHLEPKVCVRERAKRKSCCVDGKSVKGMKGSERRDVENDYISIPDAEAFGRVTVVLVAPDSQCLDLDV